MLLLKFDITCAAQIWANNCMFPEIEAIQDEIESNGSAGIVF